MKLGTYKKINITLGIRMKKILEACHPDTVLGCGGYFDKYKNKYDFKVIFSRGFKL